MTNGIEVTMQTLAHTKNGAANPLLEGGLRSSSYNVRKTAGKYIAKKGGRSALELIRNFTLQDTLLVEIIEENRERIIPSLMLAIQSENADLTWNALTIIRTQGIYELLPFLLNVFIDQGKEESELRRIEETLQKLLDKYVAALEERKNRHVLYGVILPEILNVVTKGLNSYHRNDPDLILTVFCRLYPYLTEEHKYLLSVLRNPTFKAYQPVFHFLKTKKYPAVYDLLFYCLNLPNPPQMITTIFSSRTDTPFISGFLNKVVLEPVTELFKVNIRQTPVPKWFEHREDILEPLDENAQQGLVVLLEILNISTAEILSTLQMLFQSGKGKGRLAALNALAHYHNELIDPLIWNACGDADPNIQVAALTLLEERKVPNMSVRLLQFAGSPHEQVRETVLKLLPNFRFARFAETFDLMNEEQRKMMFKLVRAMDSETAEELSQMLTFGNSDERRKALHCIRYGQMVSVLEEGVCIVLAEEESPPLRTLAAELLVDGQREASRGALVQAMHRDGCVEVRTAAKTSLENRPVVWKTGTSV